MSGRILEVGFGTGLNLPYYPAHVHAITAIDPNLGTHRLAERRIRCAGIAVDRLAGGGEQLPVESDSFDYVVCTWTLCSIDAVGQALDEIHRVLKPSGQFVFLDHGLSPEPAIRRWQRRLDWLSTRLADGCRLTRDIRAIVAASAFSSVETIEFYMAGIPWTHGYIYRGTATK